VNKLRLTRRSKGTEAKFDGVHSSFLVLCVRCEKLFLLSLNFWVLDVCHFCAVRVIGMWGVRVWLRMRRRPVCFAHYVLRWFPFFFLSQLSFLKGEKVGLSDQHAFCLCLCSIETFQPVGSMREQPTAVILNFLH